MKARDVLLVLAGGAVALVVAGIVLLAVDSDTASAPTATIEPTPTAYQRRLTGAEATALLTVAFEDNEFYFYNLRLEQAEDPELCPFCVRRGPDTIDVIDKLEECEVVDFNEASKDWIVQCSRFSERLSTGGRTASEMETFRVSDETGEYEQVR